MILKNGNVVLVPLKASDAEFYISLLNISEISDRINRPLPFAIADFDKDLNRCNNSDSFAWIIEFENKKCGVINAGARHETNGKVYQGGYWIDLDYKGNGIATKACVLVRDFLIGQGAERIQALVEPDNIASIRVLEKCGYAKEGLLKKYYPILRKGLVDVLMYAYLA